jgi:hypothetical protein
VTYFDALRLFLQYSCAAILFLAGAIKLAQHRSLAEFRLPRLELPRRQRQAAAVLLSVVEVAIGVWLALVGSGWALGVAAVLFATFAAVSWDSHRRGETASCNCLGTVLELRHDWVAASVDTGIAILLALAAVSGTHHILTLGGRRDAVVVLVSLLATAVYWLGLYARSVAGVQVSR